MRCSPNLGASRLTKQDPIDNREFLWIEDCYFHDSLLYQHYEDYPKRKIGLGVCLFSHECHTNGSSPDVMDLAGTCTDAA